MRAAYLILAVLGLALLNLGASHEPPPAPPACSTDTDCMRLCPPYADDPDCDGGPQGLTAARGNYGSQP